MRVIKMKRNFVSVLSNVMVVLALIAISQSIFIKRLKGLYCIIVIIHKSYSSFSCSFSGVVKMRCLLDWFSRLLLLLNKKLSIIVGFQNLKMC